ncbi:restriction endonuclease [Microcoleus sp. herbarium8]|uniref:restriction endonuclease n=1 Tax=Microcoleus sp. herbarium8 TaxID=3055436 RepID=UPI002FD12DBD
MASQKKVTPDWKEFEQLVARIESDAGSFGLTVTSPDRIRCKITGRLREVDASIRTKIGTSDILITIECRKRSPKQDVTWIEQLATKKNVIGAARTIAVSSSGFSREAETVATHYGIDLRRLSEVSASEINKLISLDFVLFTHKKCALARVAIRYFQSLDWTLPDPEHVDFVLPPVTDPFFPLFTDTDTGATWSLNDLWLQLQKVTDPFVGIEKGSMAIRTACFPYPGNVTVETPEGSKRIGDVLLSLSLVLEVEHVDLETARKFEYTSPDGDSIQRVEFASGEPGAEDWCISLQLPKNSTDLEQLKTRANGPNRKSATEKDP